MDGTTAAERQPTDAEALLASLATAAVSLDPYPVYARLHALGPVHRSASGIPFVTGYDACAAVARDPVFRAQSPEWNDRVAPGWRDRPAKVATFETMLFRDPPDHTRLRRLVSGVFSPRHAEQMRADVVRAVDTALDALADAGADGSPVNLQEILASSLPISVIAGIVGVPRSDWPPLQTAISQLLQLVELSVSKQQMADADRAATDLRSYFADLAAQCRAAPRDDLASALVATEAGADGQARFTHDELLQTLTFVFMAGVDTMTNLLANGTAAFLAHPRQAELLRASPDLAATAAHEVLRYDPPVQFIGRVTAAETVIASVQVPADQLVIAVIGAANRDPGRFAAPGTFDIARPTAAVLSFGGGLHYCLGAPLARLEAETFFPALLTRFPGLRLAGAPTRQGTVFRGFADLPVAWR
jgi:cytochrome P450